MKTRVHAYYIGRVQGVGFRFTVIEIATNLKLTGWVRNLDDARVELICEGNEPAVKDFLSRIESAMKRYIQKSDIDWQEYRGEFKDFDIRF